jgi:phosphatidylinositol alpha-1,6-mannosyltransferase
MSGIRYTLLAYGVELVIPLYGQLPDWRRDDFQQASRIIAVSRSTAALAADRFNLSRQPDVVNPIAGEPLSGPAIEERAAELRARLGHGPVLLSVGRLVRRKGFAQVLESVADLRRAFPDVRYVIIGDGPEREALQSRVSALGLDRHVVMLGRADDATKWAAYKVCDLFVMPCGELGGADWEGFGIVFAEAARVGRPVVAGRSGGVGDAVRDGETGVLIDPDDPAALRDALTQLLADDGARARMGDAALRMAERRFTPTALRQQLIAGLGWAQ